MAYRLLSAWPAPAKLNLLLRIVGRRPDGYHRLQTVFRFLDWGDRLWFRVRQDGRIRRVTPSLPGLSQDADLIVRAARMLRKASGCRLGADIGVDKRLPAGGGLGGGSSDAATVLVALNALWGLGWSRSALAELGLTLGADVPVFVHGRSAWAEGVGEQLTPLRLPTAWYVVLVPTAAVSTAEVFGDAELTRDGAPLKIRAFLAGVRENDCAAVVYRRWPEVAEKAAFLDRFGTAQLTGTGGCVFASFAGKQQAQAVLAQVPTSWTAVMARGIDESPLLRRAKRASAVF